MSGNTNIRRTSQQLVGAKLIRQRTYRLTRELDVMMDQKITQWATNQSRNGGMLAGLRK